ncbi:uncharacterized protein [Aegilops tauschii subsp. strangulata]|uniref:uncharacterized protein isoform X2 n=1 Tax=Aegilops tauschii subsp. strangulata TaxID=200361 RepID=UPI00098AAA2A
MGRRGKPPRSTAAAYAAVSVEGISELSVGRHRLLHKSPTPGGKRSTLISRKRQRSQSPRPAAAAAIAGIRFGRFGISPRRRSTSRKRLPKGEGSIVSGPANLCSSQFAAGIGGAIISTKILTLRHMEDDIEKAGSAKKQKTVSEKVVPVKNDLKVKKKLPLKKVESSRSDEYSSESEDEVMVQQKKAARSSKQESSSDSSDESSSDDEPAKKPAAASKKPAALASNGSKNDKSDSCSDEHDDVMFQPKKAAQSAKQESHHSDNSGESSSGKELAKKSAAASKKLAALANNASKSMKLDSSSSDIGDGADDGSSSGAAKPASKVAKKESGDDDDSSEESSGSDEENDRQVSVANSKKNEPKTAASSSHQATTRSRTLIVANLSYSVKNEQVKQFFEEAGEVIDIRFATSDDGSFKGSTHVEFATTEAAEKAYKLNGRDLAGRPVRLDFACERGTITPGSRRDNSSFKKPGQSSSYAAFIRGFDSSLGEDENRRSLQQHLSSCGEITRVSIAKDYDTCASKGIADMEFIDKSSLPKALELTGSDLGGCSLSVDEAKPSPDNRDGADSDRGCGQSGAPPRQSAGTPSAVLGTRHPRQPRPPRDWSVSAALADHAAHRALHHTGQVDLEMDGERHLFRAVLLHGHLPWINGMPLLEANLEVLGAAASQVLPLVS